MLKNENSGIEHARSSKIGLRPAFFGLEHARVQHYVLLLLVATPVLIQLREQSHISISHQLFHALQKLMTIIMLTLGIKALCNFSISKDLSIQQYYFCSMFIVITVFFQFLPVFSLLFSFIAFW